jgi:hypothetical protein
MNPLLVVMPLLASPQCDPVSALPVQSARGFTTDRPSYSPGQTIQIYDNWDPEWTGVEYLLKRIDRNSDAFQVPVSILSIASSGPEAVHSREVSYGSFVDFPTSPKPGGRLRFTIEGWFLPTWVPDLLPPPLVGGENKPRISDDVIVLAGQIGLVSPGTDPDEQPLDETIAGPGGIGIDATGTLFGAVTVGGSLHLVNDTSPLVPDAILDSSDWHHVALSYDGAAGVLKLYVDGQVRDTEEVSGTVDSSAMTFRLGARSEAPGDLTGQFDGRLDDWSLWNRALMPAQLYSVMHGTPFPDFGVQPVPKKLLEVKFEEDYSDFNPSAGDYQVLDTAGPALTHGTVINYGTPGVSGHEPGSQALRLNFDQVVEVDSDWQSGASIPIPMSAEYGMYFVEAVLHGDGFDTEGDHTMPENFQCIVVRPPNSPGPSM